MPQLAKAVFKLGHYRQWRSGALDDLPGQVQFNPSLQLASLQTAT
jgi:hypothetical protein